MRTTLAVLLLAGLCLAAADVGFICDDDGTGSYSGLGNVVPDIIGPMGETFTHELIVNNGDTGTYTGDAAWWDDYDIVIWYASGITGNGRETTTAERDAANAFLSNGGWLMVTGYDVLGNPDDSVMAELVRSSDFGDNPYETGCTVTDDTHFITNGPYGSFSGNYAAGHHDHDHYVPDGTAGCVEVITIGTTGYSKVIDCTVAPGHVTGWNGNRGCADWSPADWQNMVRNWISEALANTSNIEETTWGQIKAVF